MKISLSEKERRKKSYHHFVEIVHHSPWPSNPFQVQVIQKRNVFILKYNESAFSLARKTWFFISKKKNPNH